MTLYEIKDQYMDVFNGLTIDEDTGELLGAEQLDAIEGEFTEKAVAIACYIKELKAEAAAIEAEEQALAKRSKSCKNKADRLKSYLANAMQTLGKDKISDPKASISFRASTSVEPTDEALIPAKFWNESVTRKLDKKRVGDAIKAGQSVPGAELITKQNIQIK